MPQRAYAETVVAEQSADTAARHERPVQFDEAFRRKPRSRVQKRQAALQEERANELVSVMRMVTRNDVPKFRIA